MRTEPEQPRTNSFSTTGKILRPLVTPVISLEKWRSGEHFAGGWLTYSLGELEMFLLLLSSTAMLLLTPCKDVSYCLEIGQMQCEEQSLKVKTCLSFF